MRHFALILFLASPAPALAAEAPAASAEQKAAAAIRGDTLKAHIGFLASDLLEGRGPATRGDQLAEAYIVSQMQHAGLEPGAPDGTWLQSFDVYGIRTKMPDTFTFKKGGESVKAKAFEEFIGFANVPKEEVRLEGAELVFVGYGIQAPEYQWDDFKGMDLKGKVLLMMNNDPESDPKLFGGKTRLYYGRWTYKYESAARQGAAGAIIIHTTPSAAYPFTVIQSGWTGERFSIPRREGEPQLAVKAWGTEDLCRKIAALGGADLDKLRAAAEKADFKPVPLGVTLSTVLKNDVLKKTTANVIGKLPGNDPVLSKEAVIYSAHHDHLGINANAKPGEDAIYNGAVDNASGVAGMLAIADAFRALPRAPRRTVYFAAVAAEEQGLLGSEYLSLHLPIPAGRFAANINMDGLGMLGRTRDFGVIGLGKSTLDDDIKAVAVAQKRTITGDKFPDKGFYYRSDHFNLAKVGIPASHFNAGIDVIGKPAGYGKQRAEEYEAKDYHQPSDEVRADWDYKGAVEDAQLLFLVGVRVANAAKMPVWQPGDEFEAARKKSLEATR
jgi:Zn-dependent M28 family amino/carboxypeptidase